MNEEKPKEQTSNIPEINYQQLVADCYKTTNHPQGSIGCQAFARGAEWYRSIALRSQTEPMRAEFVRVIEFAINQGTEASEFLNAWLHGDTSEWPEFDLISRELGCKEPAVSAVR